MFLLLVALVGLLAGGVASIAGFGIGSLLTPLLTVPLGARLAVAAVALPHAVGTAVRFWRLRHAVDRHVLRGFGVASAAGGLTGALLHDVASDAALTIVFGALLVFAGLSGITGLAARLRFRGAVAWVAGALSGFFGGLVGNQGGIRSAALLAFPLQRDAFVATATAIGLLVDAARLPVYLAGAWRELLDRWPLVLVATAGVVAGTLFGARLLRAIPERLFARLVGALILVLGVVMLARGIAG